VTGAHSEEGATVLLLGGPLHFEERSWPARRREIVFPVAQVVSFGGVPPLEPVLLEVARYRLLGTSANLLRLLPVARYVG
jgi:hypothetical protein